MASDDFNGRRILDLEGKIASLRPTIAKCGPLTEEQRDILDAKRELADLLHRYGLSARGAAKLLGCSPSRIDGWLRPGDFTRFPPRHIVKTLARKLGKRELLLDEAQSYVRAAELLTEPRSGTSG